MLAVATLVSVSACSSDDGADDTTAAPPASDAPTVAPTSTASPASDPSGTDPATTTPADPTTSVTAELGASDIGVTASEIKVGFVLMDLTQVKAVMGDTGADLEVQQAAYQAYIDVVNAAGGVNGRRITPVFASFDPFVADSGATACNQVTEDDEVFAVFSIGMFGPPVLCVTQQHETPLFNVGGFAPEYYDNSAGRLFTLQPTKVRSARNGVAALEQAGLLQGKTVGILTSQAGDDNIAVEDAVVPTLEQLGHPIGRVATLSVDAGTAIGQIPVEVTQMREAGVDLVLLSTNAFISTQFIQAADQQGYRPTYAMSDADDNIADFFLQNLPETFDGRAFTARRTGESRAGVAEPEIDASCRADFEEATGQTLERDTTSYGMAMSVCNQIRLFAEAATAAGADLTRASWSENMQALTEFELAGATTGSFGAAKFDAADQIRPVIADMSCKCWMPDGDFVPMPY